MIDIKTEISEKYKEISVIIKAPKYDENVQKIINIIDNNNKFELIGHKENKLYILKTKDIIYFYSDNKKNYVKTIKDTFEIKNALYSLEEQFQNSNFIRISNSCIINIEKAESFDVSIVGSIIVRMIDGNKLIVSRRRISEVMKILKERN